MRYSFGLATALLLTYCDLAAIRSRPVRHGVWLDVAVGYGWVRVSSDTLQGRSQNGVDGILALGGTISSRLRAGVGWAQWSTKWGSGRQNCVTRYDILAYYYPFVDHSFFVEAAIGSVDYAGVHASGERADSTFISGHVWGPTVAVGWDVQLGTGSSEWSIVSLRPRLSYSYGPSRTLHSPDGSLIATGWRQRLLSLDIGLVMHQPDRR
jgi:hypothetical protein